MLHFSQQPRHRQVSSYFAFIPCLRHFSATSASSACFDLLVLCGALGTLVYEGQCIIIRISGKVPGTRCDRFLLSHTVLRRAYLCAAVCIFPHTAGRYDHTPPHIPTTALDTHHSTRLPVGICIPLPPFGCYGLVSLGHCIPGHKYRKFSRVPPRGTALRHTPKII